MPAATVERNAAGSQTVHRSEREALRLAVVPAQPREDAEVLRDLLIHADADAVFHRTVASRGHHIGHSAGLFGDSDRRGISARVGVVDIAEHPCGAIVFGKRPAAFAFDDIAAVHKQAAVELRSVRDLRHRGARRTGGHTRFHDALPSVEKPNFRVPDHTSGT